MGDLQALLDRVEKATGPDRGLDGEIDAVCFGGKPSHFFGRDTGAERLRNSYGLGVVFYSADPNINGGHVLTSHHRKAGSYTASIDAAVALVEKVLPDHEWGIADLKLFHRHSSAILTHKKGSVTADGATPPLAICAALLKALRALSDTKEA